MPPSPPAPPAPPAPRMPPSPPPPPVPAVSEIPPLPLGGLPPGWTIEQWKHYGTQWNERQCKGPN